MLFFIYLKFFILLKRVFYLRRSVPLLVLQTVSIDGVDWVRNSAIEVAFRAETIYYWQLIEARENTLCAEVKIPRIIDNISPRPADLVIPI